MVRVFGLLGVLIINTRYTRWSVDLEKVSKNVQLFFAITPVLTVTFIELLNFTREKVKKEIADKIESEIDKTKYQLYQHFYNKQQNLTIKLPDDDSVLKVEKILTSDQKLQINTYVWNRIIKK